MPVPVVLALHFLVGAPSSVGTQLCCLSLTSLCGFTMNPLEGLGHGLHGASLQVYDMGLIQSSHLNMSQPDEVMWL